ncbi:Maf-like protein [Scheffersomyces amazonensis]|uniref:Maf-like protein n=1 Tax=Scheffersomyces amazonensis TaxID=1078765 RepID=UPI00315CEC89
MTSFYEEHPVYKALSQIHFILGSTSPRRREILENNLGIPITKFEVKASEFEENLDKSKFTPREYVTQTSRLKAEYILNNYVDNQHRLILTCDTIVKCKDEVFEKPGTRENQRRMFKKYAQFPGDIEVISAITLIRQNVTNVSNETNEINGSSGAHKIYSDIETTKLIFDTSVDDITLDAYIASGEGLNVAGGFKFQEVGSLFFCGIEGDYFNVVGLPASKTFKLLNQALIVDSNN